MLKTNTFFQFFYKLSIDMYIINSFTFVQKPLAFELYGLIIIVFYCCGCCKKTFIGIVVIIRIKIILKFFNMIQIFYGIVQYRYGTGYQYFVVFSFDLFSLTKKMMFLRRICLLAFSYVSKFSGTYPVNRRTFKLLLYGRPNNQTPFEKNTHYTTF